MIFFRTLLIAMTMATLASTAYAAQVPRNIMNADATATSLVANSREDNPIPNRQMFRNPLDIAQGLQIQVGGSMINVPTSTLTVKLYDACGNLVTQASKVFDNSGLTAATSRKWVDFNLGSVPLVYGAYYYMDLSLPAGWVVPNLVLNTDKFYLGTFTGDGVAEMAFPDKKKDVLFILTGTADSAKPMFPQATTNIACPSRCFLANPSGVENVSYGPERQFNVLIRQRIGNVFPPKGSFWADYNAGTIPALKQEIANMIQGTANDPSLRETYPYNNYIPSSGAPSYYSQMNFYIAVEDPAVDRVSASGYAHRGFHHCANIDASIGVVTSGGYGGSVGKMWGEVSSASSGWGSTMRRIVVHEAFGHGVAGLWDEYASSGASGNYHTVALLASSPYKYMANALPISSGCNEWCGGTQPVSWLVGQMSADSDFACWSKTTRANCESPGGFAACRWIGDLAPIGYWDPYKCIPLRASLYNIGTNCPASGNHGCYPIAPVNPTGEAYMDVVQPSSLIMTSYHTNPPTPGFTSHIETHIKDLLDCVFAVGIPCSISTPRCANIMSRYGTPNTGYMPFLQNAPVCEGNFLRRR